MSKLEKHIREQLESIEYQEEDRMWKEFSSQHYSGKRKWGFRYWLFFFALLGLMTYALYGYFVLGWMKEENQVIPDTEIVLDANSEPSLGNTEEIRRQKPEKALPKKKNKQEIQSITRERIVPKPQVEKASKSDQVQNNKEIVQQSDLAVRKPKKPSKSDQKYAPSPRVLNADLSSLSSKKLVTNSSPFSQKISQSTQKQADAIQVEQIQALPLLPSFLLSELNLWKAQPLYPLPPFEKQEEKMAHFYAELYGARALQERSQYGLGLGYQKRLNNSAGIQLGLGLQAATGLSVSKDSLFVLREITITEFSKHKDLDHFLDAYFSGAYTYQLRDFQISIGGKLKFGLYNRYKIYESEAIRHFEFFGNMIVNTSQSLEKNDWDQLNRIRFDAFTEISYNWRQWQIGLNFSTQINRLIKGETAVALQSNRALHTGIHLRYFLPNSVK